jgi:hypothetical protein
MVEIPGGLAPGAKMWERAQVLLPEKTPSGRAYLIVVLNADGVMPETNHANNQMVVPILVDADSVPLGDPNERPRTTVAWISSKDFRELRARQSVTLQPAVQNDTTTTANARPDALGGIQEAAPVAKGPTAIKPEEQKEKPETKPVAQKPAAQATPPKVAAAPKPETKKPEAKPQPKSQPKPEAVAVQTPSKPEVRKEEQSKPKVGPKPEIAKVAPVDQEKFKPREGQAVDPKAPVLALRLPEKKDPLAVEKPAGKPLEKPPVQTPPQTAIADPKPETKPEAKPEAKPQTQPKAKPESGAPQQGNGPTSAVADTSSAVPTVLDESSLEQQPGRVLVGKGVRITTARIREPGTAARFSGVSHNPRAAVTFDADGNVSKVEMLRKSGNDDWDAVTVSSLYKWTAQGEQVKNGNLVVRWTILLGADD